MPVTDAVQLDNWYPHASYVEMRGGSELHHDTQAGVVKTLAVYHGADGSSSLWSMSDTGIYASTFGGSGGLAVAARTNGKHQYENFGDGTNNWLVAFNGVDKPWYWNGTSYTLVDGVSSPAITGVTTTTLVGVANFKGRLLLIQNDKLGFWYLPAGVVGGSATYFDLSPFASEGGYLVAIAVWTRDAGNGPDDYAVFITSQGQALVYQGTDPSSATTWGIVGSYKISRPLGRRCVLKFGSDPILLTEQGAFSLSALLSSGEERQKFALSSKIQPAFSEATSGRVDTFGWEAVSLSWKNALLINVPLQEEGVHHQYVMNTLTKAWCRFTGWDAETFAVFNGELYFAKGRRVFKAWAGKRTDGSGYYDTSTGYALTADEGMDIVYTARQSYQNLGSSALKFPTLVMPLFEMNQQVVYQSGVDADFENAQFTGSITEAASTAGVWGVSTWGECTFGGAQTISKQWGGDASWGGRWLSVKMNITSSTLFGKWLGSVIRYHTGSGL